MKDRFENWKPPLIEDGKISKWGWIVHHPDNLKMGNKTDIGSFTYINAQYGISIGDNVQIGSHCSIYSVSTIDDKHGKVKIGLNSLIGSHSTIMPNITIGNNVTVGAYSFVNINLPDNCIAYGVPVKIIKFKVKK